MKPTLHRTITNWSAISRRVLSSAAKLTLMMLCSLLLASNALAQETRPDEALPVAPQRAERESAPKRDTVPPANGKLHLNGVSATTANQVVDGDIIFTSPGQFTYPRDIKLSDNYGGLRFIGAPSLTFTPDGAAIQFFGNNATPYNGQLYLDSGAFNSAALIFRTAQTGGTITERMRVTSNGNVAIGTTNTGGRLRVETDASGPFDAVVGVTTKSGGYGVYGSSTSSYGVFGSSSSSSGVYGTSSSSSGVEGYSGSSSGVYGSSGSGSGVYGISNSGYAGEFVGRVRVGSIPPGPSAAAVCFNSAGNLLQCGTSSLRYKTAVQSFSGGLEIIRGLRPISFKWKENGLDDIGLGAEEVAKVAPSFAFRNAAGEVEGVRYERLNIVLINAVKEQQTQIERLQKQLQQQQAVTEQLQQQQAVTEGLRKLVCQQNPLADVCR